ncbi:DUF3137 domain-containing protein [Candidatus Viridilinea mediisalina]|uniref:Galanin n=1 Tax=Candidatus Viridilinea mediisalina TaxID=2024553 RepID=A0A2A6RKA8_9CHLR|nr:DUF3137 domain-containing protein [Candidatus Viridilinea mediisalina]PDW03319.1 hypothetical protein CJ255_09390 [Candidatus Viridilinea mediisalina]
MHPPSSKTQDLAQLYATELQPILDQLEAKRQEARKRALLSLGVLLPVALLLMLIVGNAFGIIFAIFLGVGALMAWFGINHGVQKRYRDFFKSEVIARLARLVDPSLVYYQDGGISIEEFRRSNLFRNQIDRYRAEDFFTGLIGATEFRFSEVHAEYKTTTTDSKGRTSTQWHTIFRGIYFIADFNKHFNGRTYVMPDTAERALGGLGRMIQSMFSQIDRRHGELINMEDPEFERIFAVRSTDQIEARYILSTSLMRRLTEFRQQLNKPVAIAFVDSQIYIAITTSKDHFEPPSIWRGGGSLSQDDIAEYFQDVRLAEQIVEDLNLNLRIWTKE